MTKSQDITPLEYKVLKDVEVTPIHWLWNPYIPRGAITGIIGDGGYGKSWMTCSIAADLSAGRPLPNQNPLVPQRVLIISAEDGVSQIIKPKMEALGADMSRVAAYDEGFTLNARMIEKIKLAIKEFDVAVVFLDPLVSYLGGSLDMYKANETRAVMLQLDMLAKAFDIAIVFVHHVKKGAVSAIQHKTLGSVDFVNGARSILLVDISKTGQYYMSHVKSNWSRKGVPLAYDFEGEKFQWLGEYHIPAGEAGIEVSTTRRGKAQSFLLHALRDGAVPMRELIKMAMDNGLTERTINRAKKGLARSVQRYDAVTQTHQWYWELCPNALPHPDAIGTTPIRLLSDLGDTTPAFTITPPDPPKSEIDDLIKQARERLH